ncbi:MAG: hypothetical protein RBR71_04715 [Gudongella sp.]|nr:hypothetical protein [Gudongella sp.]
MHYTTINATHTFTLANGIVHRIWDIQAPIRISMFKDKIEIISPGSLTNDNGTIYQIMVFRL